MPRATTNINDTERYDLKSCPGGFVLLRRLTYGQYLTRREMSASMKVGASQGKEFEGEVAMGAKKVTVFEFQNCIVEHNLENDNEELLDFRQASTVEVLDPRVGDEIGTYIDKMNQFDADSGNSETGSAPQS